MAYVAQGRRRGGTPPGKREEKKRARSSVLSQDSTHDLPVERKGQVSGELRSRLVGGKESVTLKDQKGKRCTLLKWWEEDPGLGRTTIRMKVGNLFLGRGKGKAVPLALSPGGRGIAIQLQRQGTV